ncbi:MAG: outer membrane beta-barrel family protein [Bacteroidales bacterium]
MNIIAKDNQKVIAGTTTDDQGNYELIVPRGTSMSLCFYCLGYKDTCISTIADKEVIEQQILMEEKNIILSEITINETINATEIKDQKLILNIQNTTLKETESLKDVLKYLPGAIVNDNGIEFFGKGMPIILLNGKQINQDYLFSVVKPEEIKNIELMNSSAKYDASVQKIININTIKKHDNFGIRIYSRVEKHENILSNKNYASVFLSYKKISQFIKYSNSFNRSPWYEKSNIKLYLPNDSIFMNDFSLKSIDYNNNHSLFYSFDYSINKHHNITIQATGSQSNDSSITSIESKMNNTSGSSHISEYTTPKNLGITLNYDFALDSIITALIAADHFLQHNALKNNILFNNNASSANNTYDYVISSLKADFIYSIKKIGANLDFGTQHVFVQNNYTNVFTTSDSISNLLFNNQNKMNETNQAYYIMLENFTMNNISFSMGARYENYKRNTASNSIDTTNQSFDDHYIYPSISATIPFSENTQWQLSYSTNINRQAYDLMNNINFYVNPYLYRLGNPFLKPTVSRSISSILNIGNLVFEVGYNIYTNYATMFFKLKDSLLMAYYDNCKKKEIQTSINYTINNDKLYSYLNIGAIKPIFQYEYQQKIMNAKLVQFVFNFYNSYSLNDNTLLSFNLSYNSKYQQDLFLNKPTYTMEAFFVKFLFNKKLRLAFFTNFNQIEYYTLQYKNIDMQHEYKRNFLYFGASLLFKINKDINVQSKSAIEDEKSRIR